MCLFLLWLNHLGYCYDRQWTPLPDRGCLRNDPQWVPGFLSCCSWMFPEQLRYKSELVVVQKKFIEFRQSTQKVWLSPAKLLGKFLVTLLSIFSETWVKYSSAISELSVFCDWLFLVFSGVSLETTANFLLFLNVAMILRKKLCHLWRLNWFLFYNKVLIFSIMRRKF